MRRRIEKKSLSSLRFHYDYDDIKYESYYPCQDGSDCCDGDYCRCGQILDTQILVPPTFSSVVEKVAKYYGFTKSIDIYACDRILRSEKAYDVHFYELYISPGYYGEEIDGIGFLSTDKLEKIFDDYGHTKTVKEKAEFLLKLEYGHLLDSLKDKKWTIKRVNKNDVIIPNETYFRKLVDQGIYEDYNLIKCVCLEKDGKYSVVDGYHRISENKDDKLNIIAVKEKHDCDR
jgi:hypothetical protein